MFELHNILFATITLESADILISQAYWKLVNTIIMLCNLFISVTHRFWDINYLCVFNILSFYSRENINECSIN